ncbi:hypothetical protein, partial [Nocardia brasiliensis]|uniref:hypothetical protein n=1 Tax=Nocardia brasiliensis TaxID=37326 RepID=UPI0024561422
MGGGVFEAGPGRGGGGPAPPPPRKEPPPPRAPARPEGAERGDAALLAAVNAPRGPGMRDIVATIQAEQDEIIRHEHQGV